MLREVECWQYFSPSLLLPTSSSDSPLKLWFACSTAVLLQWHLYKHITFIVKADFCSSPSGGFPLPALHAGLTKAGSPTWQVSALPQSSLLAGHPPSFCPYSHRLWALLTENRTLPSSTFGLVDPILPGVLNFSFLQFDVVTTLSVLERSL